MSNDPSGRISRQVTIMRALLGCAMVGPVAAAIVGFALPRSRSVLLSPMAVTGIAVAAGLWVGFTASGDARRRLVMVKRGFAAHGELPRLLGEYLVVYVVVLLRLEAITVSGVLVALWGVGPWVALWVQITSLALMALTWPNRRKVELLIVRAEAQR